MQSVSSNVARESLEKVFSGAPALDENLRVNRIYTALSASKGRWGWSEGFLQLDLLPEVRQGVRYGFHDDALVVAAAFVRLETDRLCRITLMARPKEDDDLDEFTQTREHDKKVLLRTVRRMVYKAAKELAAYRLRTGKKVVALQAMEGLPIFEASPNTLQVVASARAISRLVGAWGNQKPWKKRRRRRNRNR